MSLDIIVEESDKGEDRKTEREKKSERECESVREMNGVERV